MEAKNSAYQHCDTCNCKNFGEAIVLEETETTNLIKFICRICIQPTKHLISVYKRHWAKVS